MAYTNIIVVRYDQFGNIIFQSPNTLNAGSTGQGLLRVQAPFDNIEYTGAVTWTLANGQSVPQPILTVAQVEIDGVIYYQWDKPIDDTITVVSANNASVRLLVTPRFTSSNQLLVMTQASIPVTAGDVSELSPIEPDVGALLGTTKRDRDTSNLDNQGTPVPETARFTIDIGSGVEKAVTMAVIQDTVQAQGDPSKSHPTLTNSTIVDPDRSAGFEGSYNVRALRTDVNPPYDPEAQEIEIPNITTSDTVVTSTIFINQDFPIGVYTNLTLESTVQAKATAGDWILHTDIYKRDSLGVETLLQVGQDMTVSSVTYTPNVIKDTITGTFTILAGDTLALKSVIRSASGTATATAQFMGDPETTFTIFNITSGTINKAKKELLPVGTLAGKVVQTKTDRNLEVTTVNVSDILTSASIGGLQVTSEKGQPNGYGSLDANGKQPRSEQTLTAVNYIGTFGSSESFTEGDLPTSNNVQGDQYVCDEDGYLSTEAGVTFDTDDSATFNANGGWDLNRASNKVKSVNGKTGVVVLNTTDLGDFPNITIGSKGDHIVVNEAEDAFILEVGNNNTSTAVIDGMIISKGAGNTINISAGTYAILDYTDPIKPPTNRVTYAGQTNIPITTVGSGFITHVSINEIGTIICRNAHLSGDQRRVEVFLGLVEHLDLVNITNVQATPVVNNQPINTTFDFNKKAKISEGIRFSGVSGLQSFAHTAGTLIGNVNTGVTVFDPNRWDNAGTLETVPNPSVAVNHYIYMGTNDQVTIIIGQAYHASVIEANLAYLNQTDVITGIPEEVLEHSILRAIVSIDKTSTDFSIQAEALFYVPSEAVSGGGDVGSVDDDNVNNTSVLGDVLSLANQKLINEMFENKHSTFSQILQPTIAVFSDYIIDTLTSKKTNRKYRVKFTTNADTSDARLNLGNGYQNILSRSLVQLIGTDVSDLTLDLFDNGTQFIIDDNQLAIEIANKTDFITVTQDVNLDTMESDILLRKEVTYTTTIATGDWSGSDPVVATKAVIGILTTDNPIQDLDLSSVAFVDIATTQTEYAKIYDGDTSTDQVVFSALETPTEDLVITLKVGGR